MTTTNPGILTLPAGTALEEARRVKFSATTWIYAGVGEEHDGTTIQASASGDDAGAILQSSPGTFRLSMATTCTAGDLIYGAANGQGSTTKSGNPIGKAVETVTAASGIAQIMPIAPEASARLWTVAYTAVAADGTAGYKDFTPPFAAYPAGIICVTVVGATGVPRVLSSITNPGTNVIRVTVASLATGDLMSLIAFNSSDV